MDCDRLFIDELIVLMNIFFGKLFEMGVCSGRYVGLYDYYE